jgi:hypothetical protein
MPQEFDVRWHVDNQDHWCIPLNSDHFEQFSKQIKNIPRDTQKIKEFLREATVWYLTRSGYGFRAVSSETEGLCNIPF